MKSWYANFSAQPHQPFFASGIIFLFAFTALLAGVFSGVFSAGAHIVKLHAYPFIFVIFIQFFLGFLFVVFPKFLMQAAIAPAVYMRQFWLYFAASSGLLLSFLFSLEALSYAFMGLNFAVQILSFRLLYSIHKRSLVTDKHDTKWVLVGLFSGLAAHALFLLSLFSFAPYALQNLAVLSGFYLFLFIIVFTISQRMIPFFTSVKVQGYAINKSPNFMLKIYALLALKVVLAVFFTPKFQLIADVPLFALFSYEIYRWKLPILRVSAIVWVLFISLYYIPLGFLLAIFEGVSDLVGLGAAFEKSALHAFALGYFFTILIGFGTRVVLGHSARTPHADGIAVGIFLFVQAVVAARIFAGFTLNFGLDYGFFIVLSAVLMLIALTIWGGRYLPVLIKGFNPNAPKSPASAPNSKISTQSTPVSGAKFTFKKG